MGEPHARAVEAVNAIYDKRGWNRPASWWVSELVTAVLEAAKEDGDG